MTELEATATSCAVVVDVQGVEVSIGNRGSVGLAYHQFTTTAVRQFPRAVPPCTNQLSGGAFI